MAGKQRPDVEVKAIRGFFIDADTPVKAGEKVTVKANIADQLISSKKAIRTKDPSEAELDNAQAAAAEKALTADPNQAQADPGKK